MRLALEIVKLLRDKEGLCVLAFLMACLSVFSTGITHGVELLRMVGVLNSATIATAVASEGEKK